MSSLDADKFTLESLGLRCLNSIKMAYGYMVHKASGLRRWIWELSAEVTAKVYGVGETSQGNM